MAVNGVSVPVAAGTAAFNLNSPWHSVSAARDGCLVYASLPGLVYDGSLYDGLP